VGKVNQEILLDNDLYLIGSGKSVRKGEISTKHKSAESIKDMTLLFREEGSGTRIVMEKYLEKQNVQEIKRMALTSNEAIKQAVIAGLGNSIVPLIGIRNELQNGQLRIIRTPGLPITTQWRLIWLKNKKLSPVSEAYLQFLKENKTAIIKEYFSWMKAI
jgi:DNA-binding transcriptional LysR family regulator